MLKNLLENLSTELLTFIQHAKNNLLFVFSILGLLWGFHLMNWITRGKLNRLGVYPRTSLGFLGVFFSFIPHKNFNHLFFNSIPLFALLLFMVSFGKTVFWLASAMIILLSGTAVWLVGRKARHIGASGVITGYFGFILASAYLQPTFTTFFLAGITLYYFGSIVFSLFPTEESVSWESHLLGFIMGIVTLYSYPTVYNWLQA